MGPANGELLKLGIEVSQATVAKYMVKHLKPPSQTWRTFLEDHVKQLVSVDFFVVPTVSFRILYVFLVLAHERRRVVHFNVTEHPTAEWVAAQLMQASRGTRRRATYFGTVIESMARLSGHWQPTCGSRKCSRLPDLPGRRQIESTTLSRKTHR
jgi:hypothetical protein